MKAVRLLAIVSLTALPLALPATAQPASCPPGLAKKSPACVPPGQARAGVQTWGVGDRLDRDFVLVERSRYGLPPLAEGEAYVRVGDQILRLDRTERLILDVVDVILN